METFLKDNDNMAVPNHKGTGFCVMKRQSCRKKLADILDCTRFQEMASALDKFALKNEKAINSALLDMKKSSLLRKTIYQKLRSIGAQTARLYGLTTVHENV